MMIEKIIQSHLERYPAMQIPDLYKLLHQAALGSEHAVSDRATARRWLVQEMAELRAGPSEELIDPISPDTLVVRIHLRPYAAAEQAPELLLEAFIRTANEFRGDIRTFEVYWQAACELGHFPANKMTAFIHTMRSQNYPAVQHSPQYKQHYRPAYRVISQTFCNTGWLEDV